VSRFVLLTVAVSDRAVVTIAEAPTDDVGQPPLGLDVGEQRQVGEVRWTRLGFPIDGPPEGPAGAAAYVLRAAAAIEQRCGDPDAARWEALRGLAWAGLATALAARG
jgi:hypothetical protein